MSIRFERSDKKNLNKQGYQVVDMHAHSTYSDGINDVNTLIKKAKKKQFGFCLTDHNKIKGSLKLCESNVFTIPSIEINTLDGPHILAYFYNKDELKECYKKKIEPHIKGNPNIKIHKRFEDTIHDLQDYNCVYSVAHPFAPFWLNFFNFLQKEKRYDLLKKLPTFEAINGAQLHKANKRAKRYIEDKELMFTAGSDAHIVTELGTVLTYTEGSTVEEFLNAIKKKQNSVIGKENKVVSRILVNGFLIKTNFEHFIDKDKYRVYNPVKTPELMKQKHL